MGVVHDEKTIDTADHALGLELAEGLAETLIADTEGVTEGGTRHGGRRQGGDDTDYEAGLARVVPIVVRLSHDTGRCCTAPYQPRIRLRNLPHKAAIASLFSLPSSVIRLTTFTATAASRCWASNVLARRWSPMMRL